jgi:hypothetical protein
MSCMKTSAPSSRSWKSPKRACRARWAAPTCPTTRAEARGGDDEELEVVAGACAQPLMTTSPGGWTPIRASQTTTQAVPASRPAGRSVTNGEPPAEPETFDRFTHDHVDDCAIFPNRRRQCDRLARQGSGSSVISTDHGMTCHLAGGFGDLRVHGRWCEKTQVAVMRAPHR